MVYSCAVRDCKERFVKGSGITFHCFPKDEALRKIWVTKINRKGFVVKSHSKICSKHFTEKCFDKEKFGGTWLKPDAIPTLFNLPPRRKPKKRKCKQSEDTSVPLSSDTVPTVSENCAQNNLPLSPNPSTTIRYVSNDFVPTSSHFAAKKVKLKEMHKMDFSKNKAENKFDDKYENKKVDENGKENKNNKNSCKRTLPNIKTPVITKKTKFKVEDREDVFGRFVASEIRVLSDNPALRSRTEQAILEILGCAHFELLNPE